MHLTCIGAAERPHTEVRAGLNRSLCRDAREGMPACRPWRDYEDFDRPGPAIPGGALAGTKTR